MQKLFPAFLILTLLIIATGCVTTAEEWNQRGKTHHTMGRYEEAVAAYDQAIAINPENGEAWRNRGLSLSMLGRVNESEESFARALAINQDDAGAYYYQALARNATGNRSGAFESLDRAIAIPPKDKDQTITLFLSLMLKGNLLALENRSDEANVSYRMANRVMMGTGITPLDRHSLSTGSPHTLQYFAVRETGDPHSVQKRL
jgi:Flp pilus assembly protein TadD, contains TPR repeats